MRPFKIKNVHAIFRTIYKNCRSRMTTRTRIPKVRSGFEECFNIGLCSCHTASNPTHKANELGWCILANRIVCRNGRPLSIRRRQYLDNGRKASGQGLLKVRPWLLDSMIRDTILRKIVGTYFLRAFTCSDLNTPLRRTFSRLLLILCQLNTTNEKPHGFLTILLLTAFRRTLHFNTGRLVNKPDGSLYLIDILATRTT